MRGTVALHHSLQTSGVRVGPAVVRIISEAQPRHILIPACTEHGKGVDPVEHPSSEPHGLEHQGAGIATRRQFSGQFCQRRLVHKGDGPDVIHVCNCLKLFNTGNSPFIDIVVQHQTILQHVAQIQQNMLGQITNRDHEQRCRVIGDPSVVWFGVGNFGR